VHAWDALTKEAAPNWGQLAQQAGSWLKAQGPKLVSDVKGKANAIKGWATGPAWSEVKQIAKKPQARWAGAGLGALGAAGTLGTLGSRVGEVRQQWADASAQDQAAQALNQKLIAQANSPPDALERGFGTVKNVATNYWPLLVGGGAALGGLGLWYKNRLDRQRKQEEEDLLRGMAKVSMAKLAAEFPIQIGFLARCGERGLTGSEVRAAIEKCASISDGLAEDWTRFFAGAAELEAGASPKLTKAAQGGAGLSATFDAAIKQHPQGQQPAQQGIQPAVKPLPGTTGQQQQQQQQPAGLTAAQPGAAAVQASGAPTPSTASPDLINQREQWSNQLNQASRQGDTVTMRQLQANPPPPNPPAAAPGQQAFPVADLAARQQQLKQERDWQAQHGYAAGVKNFLTRDRAVSTYSPEERRQNAAAEAAKIQQGMDPNQAARENPTSDINAPTWKSRLWGSTMGTGRALSALIGVPTGFVSDVGNLIRGRPGGFLPNTGAAARDFLSPITEADMPRYSEARQQTGNRSFFGDVTPEWTRTLQQVSQDPNQNILARTGAGMGSHITGQAELLSGLASGGIAAKGLGAALAGAKSLPMLSQYAPKLMQAGNMLQAYPKLVVPTTKGHALLHGALAAAPQLTGQALQQGEMERQMNMISGKETWDPTKNPPPENLEHFPAYAESVYQNQRTFENMQRAQQGRKPMNAAEEENFRAQKMAPLNEYHEQQQNQQVASTIPGMADAQGNHNPNGQIDTSGIDPNDVAGWMNAAPGRIQAMDRVQRQSMQQLDQMTKSLPPELTQRLTAQGGQLTPEDMATMKQAGVNTDALQQTTQRLATTSALAVAFQSGGNLNQVMQKMQTPQGMMDVAQKNPSIQQAAEQKVQSGEQPSFMSAIMDTCSKMGPMGMVLALGGMALGTISLMNAFSGEGGLGSILGGLLGGGALALGLNKGNMLPSGMSGMINPLLQRFGLGALAGTTPQAGLPQPGAGGEPTVSAPATPAPAAPAAGATAQAAPAAKQLGIDLSPAGRAAMMAMPLDQQVASLKQGLTQDPAMAGKLQQAYSAWNAPWGMLQGTVKQQIRQQPGLENMSDAEIQKLMEVYGQTQKSAAWNRSRMMRIPA
jgi:hypothetical protein